jgi:hypothetical protein
LKGLAALALFLALVAATLPESSAQVSNLFDGNSVVQVNVSSPAGMFNYSVDGVNQVNNQWFYYKAGAMSSDASIDSVGALTSSQSSARNLSLTYSGAQYSAQVVYSLTGGSAGSGQSGLNETITFNNSSSTSLSLSFFNYSNYRLAGMSSGQTLQFGTTSIPPPPHYNNFTQTAGSVSLTEKLISAPTPSHIEAAQYNQTLSELNSASPATLNDNAGPVNGDVTGTFEWDVTLAAGKSLTISELINITSVPEPSSTLMLALGLAIGLALARHGTRSARFSPLTRTPTTNKHEQ